MKTYFIIQTAGRTATQWIARALNQLNDIFCSHGPDLEPGRDDYEERFIRIHKQMNEFQALGPDSYFDMLEEYIDKNFYGNIHGGFNVADIFRNPGRYKRSYNLCYIVRHPINRIESFVNRWLQEIAQHPDTENFYHTEYEKILPHNKEAIEEVADSVDFQIPSNYLFVYAIQNVLGPDFGLFDLGIPYFKMEYLTSEYEYFADFLKHITKGRLSFEESFLRKIIQQDAIDQSSPNVTADMLYSEWENWKKNLLLKHFENIATRRMYLTMGYDVPL